MKNHRKFRPAAVESLETLALPSAGLGHLPAALVPARQVARAPQLHLNGAVSGSFVAFLTADSGVQINLAAIGTVAPLGQVTALGQATESLLPTSRAGANAYLVLNGAQGSVTIAMHATLPKHGTLIPSQFSYAVVGGTGVYANMVDHGTARLNYHLTPPSAAGQTLAVAPVAEGVFNVQLHSARGR